MNNYKTRVRSDRINQYREENKEWLDGETVVPVDLYGKRITEGKNGNLEKIGEDVKEFYDLEGDTGLR